MTYLIAPPNPSLTTAWLEFLTPLVTALLIVVNLWITKRNGNKVDRNTGITIQNHILLNSRMGQQLLLHAISARALSDLTKNPEHIQAAEVAELKLQEHEARQQIIDRMDVLHTAGGQK